MREEPDDTEFLEKRTSSKLRQVLRGIELTSDDWRMLIVELKSWRLRGGSLLHSKINTHQSSFHGGPVRGLPH